MFGIPYMLRTDAEKKRQRERQAREVERRAALAVPWDPAVKWAKELQFQADTYKPRSLFAVSPTNAADINDAQPRELAISPGRAFCYAERVLPRGAMLATAYGRERGSVLFDGPVVIPKLHCRSSIDDGKLPTHWDIDPWMSITPMEVVTLRPGTRLAKRHVVVAGLGLGYQLVEVSRRKQVTKITLVEVSRELVDWILPRVAPHLGRALDDVVVGDVYKVLPKMRADVALVDVFPGYGGNDWERDKLRASCPNVGHVWAWGAGGLR